jgi:hypothetical protein
MMTKMETDPKPIKSSYIGAHSPSGFRSLILYQDQACDYLEFNGRA